MPIGVATRSKTETAVEEVGFEYSLEYARDRSLQQPVRDRPSSTTGEICLLIQPPARNSLSYQFR
jgi:hypothetical protein